MRGVQGVVFDDGGAQFEYGVERGEVLGTVGQQDGDAVPRADAKCTQAGGSAADLFVQFGIGLCFAEEVGGGFVRVECQVVIVDVEQGGVAVFEVVRHPLGVVLQPWPVAVEVRCVCGVRHGRALSFVNPKRV